MINQIAIIHTDGRELTQREIDEVLRALGRHKDKLPPVKYEYRPPVKVISPRETLYITPKDKTTQFAYIPIQGVLDQEFPGEYTAEAI